MKKNKMMRVASALLVAVLMTTSVISGTFAKYVTQDSASDTARVAKWGVELQVVGNLFGDTYKDVIVLEGATNLTVQSVDQTADIVAPGTKNEQGFTFSLKGKPEVKGEVTTTMKVQNVFLAAGTYVVMLPVDADLITEANFDEFDNLYYKDGSDFKEATSYSSTAAYYTAEDEATVGVGGYYPVVYTLAGNTTSSGNTTADTLNAAAVEIATQLGLTTTTVITDVANKATWTYTGTKVFDANTDLATWACDGLTLTWAWAFDGVNDGADTILGVLENTTEGTVVKLATNDNDTPADPSDDTTYFTTLTEYTDYCLDTMFSIDITVTQVD